MLKQHYFYLSLIATLSMSGAMAKEHDADSTLAFTYAYAPTGSASDLAAGYKNHLKWHIANQDPIVWYAWFVVEGDRLGHFIDGAFDVSGAEFDARPDPAGDAADATANFLPHADMQYRRIFRLRTDLGTAAFLEDRNPSPLMQVVYYEVFPGSQLQFEAAAAAIAVAAARERLDFSLYELLTGASGPLYAMYVPLQGFRSFDDTQVTLEMVAKFAMPEDALMRAMADLRMSTKSIRSEVWQYRSDLSSIPDKN